MSNTFGMANIRRADIVLVIHRSASSEAVETELLAGLKLSSQHDP